MDQVTFKYQGQRETVDLKIILAEYKAMIFWTYGCIIGVTEYPLLGVTA